MYSIQSTSLIILDVQFLSLSKKLFLHFPDNFLLPFLKWQTDNRSLRFHSVQTPSFSPSPNKIKSLGIGSRTQACCTMFPLSWTNKKLGCLPTWGLCTILWRVVRGIDKVWLTANICGMKSWWRRNSRQIEGSWALALATAKLGKVPFVLLMTWPLFIFHVSRLSTLTKI